MKLRYKLMIIPILIAIFVFSGIIIFTNFSYRQSALESLNISQVRTVETYSQTVDEYLKSYKNVVTQLSTLDIVKDTDKFSETEVKYRGLPDTKGIDNRNLFINTMEIYPNFAYLEVFNEDVISVLLEPYEIQLTVDEDDYKNGFSYRDWYKGAIENNGSYISEAYVSASIWEPVVAISTPIFNDEDIVGVMIGAVKLEELSDKISELSYGKSGITYMIDKNSNMVAHPDKSYLEGDKLYNLKSNQIIDHIKETNGTFEGTILLYDDITEEKVYVYYQKAGLADWYIISQISVSEFEEELSSIFYQVFIVALILLSMYVIFLLWDTKSIVDKLSFLETISKRISYEDFSLSEEEIYTLNKNGLIKNEIGTLMNSYHQMIDSINDSFKFLEDTNQKIEYLAEHDPLTDLSNRRHFVKHLDKIIKAGHECEIILMDMDNFKLVNDTMGHMFGDKVLIEISNILKGLAGTGDLVSRFGGDEFIIFVSSSGNQACATEFIERAFSIFKTPLEIEGTALDISFSVGISKYPENSSNIDHLIKYADLALYSAKRNGKNQYFYFDQEMEESVYQNTAITKELKSAIKNDGFELVYQPQVELVSGTVKAYEALIRLKNGTYSPNEFIKTAEETGMILEIGRWVFSEAVRQISEWKNMRLSVVPVSVNFSAKQLNDKEFISFMKETFIQYDVDPELIELEITENIFIDQIDTVKSFFSCVRQLGVRLSIDDFGTGYSSLNYVFSLPITKIKLDRTIVDNLIGNYQLETVKSLIDLAHSLDLEVVAEGIELIEDVHSLMDAKCDMIQGYYFDKPLKVDKVVDNLKRIYPLN